MVAVGLSVNVRTALIALAFVAANSAADDGAAAFRSGNFDDAFAAFTRRAAQADPVGQNNLGVMYLKGHGVAVDFDRARALFTAAASAGLPGAMFNLGMLHRRGYGVAVNLPLAVTWFEQAAAAGDREASFFLGLMFHKGEGVAVDPARARALFETAAAAGLPAAQYNLAMLQLQESDESQATRWLVAASAQGHESARLALARLDLAHVDEPTRLARAAAQLRELADDGNAEAQMHYGLLNTFGRGVPENPEEGRFWLRQAALQSYVPAQMNLGTLYAEGIGTPADPIQAFAWLKLASDSNAQASAALARVAAGITAEQRAEAEILAIELAAKTQTQ